MHYIQCLTEHNPIYHTANDNVFQEHILFVDPFSSTKFLAENLKNANISVSVLYSVTPDNHYLCCEPELFDHVFFLKDFSHVSALINELAKFNISRVYYGSEISVVIADEIAHALTPQFANQKELALARSDKFEMQECLRKKGLPFVKQIKVNKNITAQQISEISKWKFPLVFKPINDACSNGVNYCHSMDDVLNYLKNHEEKNLFGQQTTQFVIQTCLVGEEYFIDTFSHDNHHSVSGIQRYQRIIINNRPISVYSETISLETSQSKVIIDFVKNALSAVGLKNGFAHTEIMLTEDGPYLIEINPRISGGKGSNNKLFQYAGYVSQVNQLIASCQQKIISAKKQRFGRRVCLQNYVTRKISPLNITLLARLDSYVDSIIVKEPETIVNATSGLIDVIAFVLLVNADAKKLEDDYQQLKYWEAQNLLF